jgi:hypothetical protein
MSGHLFEDQVLDLGLGDPLVDEARTGVEQQGVADPDRLSVKAFSHPADALFVGVRHHEHPVVAQELLEHHDLAPTRSKPQVATTFRASLSMTSRPADSSPGSTDGETATRILRPLVRMSTVASS